MNILEISKDSKVKISEDKYGKTIRVENLPEPIDGLLDFETTINHILMNAYYLRNDHESVYCIRNRLESMKALIELLEEYIYIIEREKKEREKKGEIG